MRAAFVLPTLNASSFLHVFDRRLRRDEHRSHVDSQRAIEILQFGIIYRGHRNVPALLTRSQRDVRAFAAQTLYNASSDATGPSCDKSPFVLRYVFHSHHCYVRRRHDDQSQYRATAQDAKPPVAALSVKIGVLPRRATLVLAGN